MKKYELERFIEGLSADAEIFIETDGLLHDFRCEERPEVFDGFDTVYEAGINLITTD